MGALSLGHAIVFRSPAIQTVAAKRVRARGKSNGVFEWRETNGADIVLILVLLVVVFFTAAAGRVRHS